MQLTEAKGPIKFPKIIVMIKLDNKSISFAFNYNEDQFIDEIVSHLA